MNLVVLWGPLSPILIDMVIDNLETDCLQQLDFNVSVFYVDDIFTILFESKIN